MCINIMANENYNTSGTLSKFFSKGPLRSLISIVIKITFRKFDFCDWGVAQSTASWM